MACLKMIVISFTFQSIVPLIKFLLLVTCHKDAFFMKFMSRWIIYISKWSKMNENCHKYGSEEKHS